MAEKKGSSTDYSVVLLVKFSGAPFSPCETLKLNYKKTTDGEFPNAHVSRAVFVAYSIAAAFMVHLTRLSFFLVVCELDNVVFHMGGPCLIGGPSPVCFDHCPELHFQMGG